VCRVLWHFSRWLRLNGLRLCSKGVQPVPKAVYCNGLAMKLFVVGLDSGTSHTGLSVLCSYVLRTYINKFVLKYIVC